MENVQDIYVIGDERRLVVRSFLNELRDAGLEPHVIGGVLDCVMQLPRKPIHVVVCFDDEISAESIEYLRGATVDKGWNLYLVGKINGLSLNEEKKIMLLPGVRFPVWPVPVKSLLDAIKNSRKKILIVDDEPMMLRSLKSFLSESFDVSLVASGKNAIEFLFSHKVDLVLLDYEMPEMNGKDVLAQIRATFDFGSIPVIFLTAKSDKDTVMDVMSLHPNGYILKTSSPNEIRSTLYKYFIEHTQPVA